MSKSESTGKFRRAKLRHKLFTLGPDFLLRGRLRERHLKNEIALRHFQVRLPNWRADLGSLRIGHLSDLHFGDLMPPERVEEIVDVLRNQALDMVAFTGDAVDLEWRGIEHFFDLLASVPAPLGHVMVLGNHDHLDDADAVVEAARARGIMVLMDEVATIALPDGGVIRVGGVDWTKRLGECSDRISMISEQLSEEERPIDLLLSHNPKGFIEATRQRIPLTLAGHTHGGQVALKGRPDRNLAVAHRLSAGFYERKGSALFVTTGVGSWFPLRVHCPPEVVVLEVSQGDWVEPDPESHSDVQP
jgi:predicted MPP superfamily phosphohydrolase